MNRKQKKGKKTEKTIKIATRLFLNQGFENTSVRQILKESGLSTGSFYNLFKNKNEILLKVFMGIGSEVINLSKQIADRFEDPGLGHFIAVAVEKLALLESQSLINVYRFIWTVPAVQEFILQNRVENAQRILSSLKLNFDYEEIYIRVLASMGIERALIEAKIDGRIHIKPEEVWSVQTTMFLASYGVSNKRSEIIIKNVLEIMENEGKEYKADFIEKIVKTER